ncbi:hypothetical protein [Iodobacter fluviatilis]|uniref:Uncharacterized protein n=1 Tax=Iodobacter fluviatilis TaxID=537 RepID=A0A377Q7L2_9NEIS|nr:hypothetical protein [Iodobacter fluviatilis]TCU89447.1 hypothetical protein EV682_102359 [Iodobacter fluviatilis]STQ90817.1 Uncharacterised protein [Iodobacter fluviatilis]
MASSKVKEITEEVIVEQEKPVVRNVPASRRRTKQVLPEAVQEVLVEALPAEQVSQMHKKTKLTKVKKPRLVRDSFTIPEAEYIQLAELKQRCLEAGLAVKKSELLRAGLQALVSMPDERLIKQFDSIEKLKTGRPSKTG